MTGDTPIAPALKHLAEAAGLAPVWQDVYGGARQVPESVLRSVLIALDLPCGNARQIADSTARLTHEANVDAGAMLIFPVNTQPVFRYTGPLIYTLTMEDGKHYIGRASRIGADMVSISEIAQPGYHQLTIGELQLTLAITPERCPSVSELSGRHTAGAWGVAAQVYSLQREHDTAVHGLQAKQGFAWPVWPGWETGGDFGALAELARHAGHAGASALAISPVHAMFSADPQRYSPYSPSSRLFLNVGYIEPAMVLGEAAVRHAVAQMTGVPLRDAAPPGGYIAWPDVLARRMALLGRLYDDFCRQGRADLVEQYAAFRQRGGEALESHARYEALHAHHLTTLGPANGWQDWPAELRDCQGPAVKQFAAQHQTEIGFHIFLQWLADGGMRHVQQCARGAGMPIGLIADMAIGTDPRGSHAWSRQQDMLTGVTVGAPPDLYQSAGQGWGLTAFSPRALRQHAYAAFLATLRATLAYAGGIRIDHILGFARLWLIPQGASPAEGVYLRYPLADMLSLVALEASRHKAIVIGENLGTVPEGFNDVLGQKGILGTSVLWFERSAGQEAFLPPSRWSPHAVAMPTTHDLPTIAGWWEGRDLTWRERLGQLPPDQGMQQADQRGRDKTALWRALQEAGCVSTAHACPPAATPGAAVLAFVASTPAPLVVVGLEDLLGLAEQPNLPGATDAGELHHPNWTQCLPVTVNRIFAHPAVMHGVAAIKRARRQS